MKACAIVDKGIEKVCSLELSELIKAKSTSEERVVFFEAKDDDVLKFCYLTQSSQRVLELFDSFSFKDYDDFLKQSEKIISKIDLKKSLEKDTTFRVACERIGEHDFGSSTAEQDIGEFILKKAKQDIGFEPKVSLESPDLIIYVLVNDDKAYIGIDLVGRDLSKRQYRIFTSPGTVNSNLTYAMIRLSNYSKKERLVDLFCKAGLICIEAALYNSGTSSSFYNKDFAFKKLPNMKREWDDFFKKIDLKRKEDRQEIIGFDPLLRNIEASKKNAKLAGIDKLIMFSKMDLDWTDTKLDEKSVDAVISRIVCPSKNHPESDARKTYKELFYQAEFFLKKKGRLCLLTENTELLRSMIPEGFGITKEEVLFAGKQRYEYLIIEKK